MDRVQVIKQESAALGGDEADESPFDSPIQPQEDAIEAAGVYFQDAENRDEALLIWRVGNNLKFKDISNPSGKTLSELLSGASGDEKAKVSANDTTAGYLNGKLVAGTGVSLVEQNDGSNETLRIDASGSGITEAQHKILRQLIHFIDEGPAEGFTSLAYKETLPVGDPFPTSVTWYESSSKAVKIVEKIITRTGGGATKVKPTPIVWKVYNSSDALIATVSDAIAYSGVFESTRTRTITIA